MKIFYDVTHLIGWKGGLTGIPRTTDEIGIRLKEREDVDFVAWDIAKKQFMYVDKKYYYDVVAEKNRNFFKNTKAKVIAAKHPIHKKVARRVLVELPFLAKAIRKISAHHKVVSNTAHFEKGLIGSSVSIGKSDALFVPCGLWDDKNYIEYIQRIKTKGGKVAFICYDLLPIVVPQFSGQWGEPMKNFTRKITAHSDVVFSISAHTKEDLISWLKSHKLPIPNIEVIRLGDVYELSNPATPRDDKLLSTSILSGGEEFILCTGTVEARKNHTLLYYLYKLAKSKGIDLPKTVVVGRPGHRTENIIDIIKDDPDTKNKIIMLFDTSDQELSWLYSHCRFTIYPSWYEGWGLPIAESIANGVPCITSKTSSMTEVADGFVRYFDPSSPEDCLQAVLEYLDDKKLKAAKEKTKQYKPISWDLTYMQIEQSLAKLSKGSTK